MKGSREMKNITAALCVLAVLCGVGCNCKNTALKHAIKMQKEGVESRVIVYDSLWDANLLNLGLYNGHAEAQKRVGDQWQWLNGERSEYRTGGEIVRTYRPEEFRKYLGGEEHAFDMLICDEWIRFDSVDVRKMIERAGGKEALGEWSQARACKEKYGEGWREKRKPVVETMGFRESIAWGNLALFVIAAVPVP